MKLLFDYLPILLFFIGYKVYGIYVASMIAIVASLLQVAISWIRFGRIPGVYTITFLCFLFMGGATILLHDEFYIKWKPTVAYWILAFLFLGSHFIGEKTFIQRLMDNKLILPKTVWQKLNLSWVLFFIFLGFANLYVIYHFSTNSWVNFKFFGTLVLSLIFVVGQSLYMAKHIAAGTKNSPSKDN